MGAVQLFGPKAVNGDIAALKLRAEIGKCIGANPSPNGRGWRAQRAG